MIIKDLDVNYVQYGNKKKKDIVLLHGWNQNIEMMNFIGNKLKEDFHITVLDIPGFGKTSEPKNPYTIYDYSDFLYEFLKNLNINKPILIGHSLGGSISIVYSSLNEVEKLILFGSPFKRKDMKNSIKYKVLKFFKKVPILNKFENLVKNLIGSNDYKKSSEVMRKTLVNIVNQDLEEELKKIEVPTLLMWGDKDTAAKVEDAYYAESIMKDAGLVVFENSTHYAYLENLDKVILIINEFLGGKK